MFMQAPIKVAAVINNINTVAILKRFVLLFDVLIHLYERLISRQRIFPRAFRILHAGILM